MRAVLLSIKPEFAHKIFDGSKKYEFRKQIFKDPSIKTIIVYSSFPERKVIGEFNIGEVLNGSPADIWERTNKHSGITREFFDQYFHEKKNAYAIKVSSVNSYSPQKKLSDFGISSAPQSFVYVEV